MLLLSGEGACFTGGNDLKDFLSAPAVIGSDHVISRFLRALSGFGKILIAAVHGPTVGIGATLLLHCDLVLAAARSTRIIMPFVQLGVVPEAASTLLLPRLLGHQRAAEMFFLGQPLDAQTAREWGLVNRVVEDEALMEEARALADAAARQPPGAVRATKRLMRAAESAEVAAHMQEELREFASRLRSAEFAAAAQAFFGKPVGRQRRRNLKPARDRYLAMAATRDDIGKTACERPVQGRLQWTLSRLRAMSASARSASGCGARCRQTPSAPASAARARPSRSESAAAPGCRPLPREFDVAHYTLRGRQDPRRPLRRVRARGRAARLSAPLERRSQDRHRGAARVRAARSTIATRRGSGTSSTSGRSTATWSWSRWPRPGT